MLPEALQEGIGLSEISSANERDTHSKNIALADREQASRILEFAAREEMSNSVGLTKVVFPPYDKEVSRGLKVLGDPNYYNGGGQSCGCWPDIACLHAAALKIIGQDEEADRKLEVVKKLLERHGTLHEIYDDSGEPREFVEYFPWLRKPAPISKRFGRRACPDFAMALGTFLWVKTNWENLLTFSAIADLIHLSFEH